MVYKRLEHFLIQLDTVDSTNIYASQLLKTTEVVNGTIVWAHDQHAGKGQHTNTWTSEAGKNLTCSIILKTPIPAVRSFYLNIVVSLAVRKCLSDLGLSAEIKWPNDLLIQGKKIGGILIENQISGQNIVASIVGLGLNVNQTVFAQNLNATSISLEKGQDVLIEDVLNQFYGYLDFYLDLLLQSHFELLKKHYYKHLFLLGKPANFSDDSGLFQGVIEGIDESGKLIINRTGGRRKYNLKEVQFND